MPEFQLTVDLSNDAFANGNKEAELARILRFLALRVENGLIVHPYPVHIVDINGNKCGHYSVVEMTYKTLD